MPGNYYVHVVGTEPPQWYGPYTLSSAKDFARIASQSGRPRAVTRGLRGDKVRVYEGGVRAWPKSKAQLKGLKAGEKPRRMNPHDALQDWRVTERQFWDRVSKAADEAHARMMRTGGAERLYLYSSRSSDQTWGELATFSEAETPPGRFELAWSTPLPRSLTRDQLVTWIYEKARKLPILPTGRNPIVPSGFGGPWDRRYVPGRKKQKTRKSGKVVPLGGIDVEIVERRGVAHVYIPPGAPSVFASVRRTGREAGAPWEARSGHGDHSFGTSRDNAIMQVMGQAGLWAEGQKNPDDLECIDCGKKGRDVELRHPGYGIRSFPRCAKCGEARLERERTNRQRYFGPQPSDFDSDYAGERWDDEEGRNNPSTLENERESYAIVRQFKVDHPRHVTGKVYGSKHGPAFMRWLKKQTSNKRVAELVWGDLFKGFEYAWFDQLWEEE